MNQTVNTVMVSLTRVRVNNFSPNEARVDLEINFNDGKDQTRRASTYLKHPTVMATQLLQDIFNICQDNHCEFDGESLFEADIILLREDAVRKQLLDFFRTLYSKTQQLRNMKTAENYMNTMRSLDSELIL